MGRSGETGLPIRTGAGQHLVDAHDVVGVDADAAVEGLLANVLAQILVAANTGGLKRFGRELEQQKLVSKQLWAAK